MTSVFFLFCLYNVIFLLSLLTHPTLAYINSTSSLYLLHFILFQISNQITMNKNRLFSPHSRHSYPSSMKEVCHHRLSSPTCHESPTTQWKGIWSTYRTVAGSTPNFSTPSSFSWVYLSHSLKDIMFHSLFSWKCCLFGWKVWESFRNNLYGTTLHVPSFWYLAMIENKYTVIAYFCLYFDSVVPLSISTYLKLRPS